MKAHETKAGEKLRPERKANRNGRQRRTILCGVIGHL